MWEKVKGGSQDRATDPDSSLLHSRKFLLSSGSNTFKAEQNPGGTSSIISQ